MISLFCTNVLQLAILRFPFSAAAVSSRFLFSTRISTIVIYRKGAGLGSRGVRARGRRRRVQVVGIAAFCVWRRRAAFAVLLRRQVLAARCGRRRERLRVVVEVAGVALGSGGGFERPAARRVVAVADVGAAGRGGRGKVAVGVGPVTGRMKTSVYIHQSMENQMYGKLV